MPHTPPLRVGVLFCITQLRSPLPSSVIFSFLLFALWTSAFYALIPLTTKRLIALVAILLGFAIAALGLAGITWIVSSHLLGHGMIVIFICALFVTLGARSILGVARLLRQASANRK